MSTSLPTAPTSAVTWKFRLIVFAEDFMARLSLSWHAHLEDIVRWLKEERDVWRSYLCPMIPSGWVAVHNHVVFLQSKLLCCSKDLPNGLPNTNIFTSNELFIPGYVLRPLTEVGDNRNYIQRRTPGNQRIKYTLKDGLWTNLVQH